MVEIEFLGPIKMHNLKLEAANLSEVKEKLGEYAQHFIVHEKGSLYERGVPYQYDLSYRIEKRM